jgi:hypothetical protein
MAADPTGSSGDPLPPAPGTDRLALPRSWRRLPSGSWLDELGDRLAARFPDPSDLPRTVVRVREALGLPADEHLIVTTNHAAATVTPWNLARPLFAESLAERLRRRGVAARSVVIPLDHNTLGEANRPGHVVLGGRSWGWPGLPRDPRRAVATLQLEPPGEGWWRRISETAGQDGARAWRRLEGHPLRAGLRRTDLVEAAADALRAVREIAGERQGAADLVWSGMQAALFQSLGFRGTTVVAMSGVEEALARHAPLSPGALEDLGAASASVGNAFGEAGRAWDGGVFWFLCRGKACRLTGILQPMPPRGRASCRDCGLPVPWSPADLPEGLAEGSIHPRVHLLVPWLRRGLAPLVHTAGPGMVRYASRIDAIEDRLASGGGSPLPQLFLPLGKLVPAVVLSPLYLGLLPEMEAADRGMHGRGPAWRRVVEGWYGAAGPEGIEKRLGPRLRQGGFPQGAGGAGTLEAALRSWGWWPPRDLSETARAASRRPLREAEADLVDGLIAAAHPLRWAGGWDWLAAGIDAGDLRRRLETASLHSLDCAGAPASARPPCYLPRALRDRLGESAAMDFERRFEDLAFEAPEARRS